MAGSRGYRTRESYISKDPEKRAKQFANLSKGTPKPKGWFSSIIPTLPDPKKFPCADVMAAPVSSAKEILGVKLWQKQQELLTAIAENPLTACRSANACGKTFVLAVAAILWLLSYADAVVVTTSSSYRQLKLLWREFHRLLAKSNVKKLLGRYVLNQMELRIDQDRYAVGVSANIPENLSGFHSGHVLVIADESSALESEHLEALLSNGTGEHDRVVICGNPLRPSGPFYDAFRDNGWKTMSISALEAAEAGISGLASRKWIEQRKQAWGEGSPAYLARVLGQFPEAGTDSIITLVDVESACERQASAATGKRIAGIDLARFGDDRSVAVIRQGDAIVHVESWSKLSLMESCGRILEVLRQWSVEILAVDETGLGSGLVDRLKELKIANVLPVTASSSPNDKTRFLNRRAELYWHLKDRIKTLSIPWIHRDKFQELASIKYLFNSNGKIQIESKSEIKSRLGKSPDFGDALALSFATEIQKPKSTGVFWNGLPDSSIESLYNRSLQAQKLEFENQLLKRRN